VQADEKQLQKKVQKKREGGRKNALGGSQPPRLPGLDIKPGPFDQSVKMLEDFGRYI